MKNSIWSKLFKTSALYLFGTVIAKLVSFLLLPLYTDKIPTDVYGLYDIVITYAAIIVPLIGVNCWQGMLRFVVEESDIRQKHRLVSNGWFMLVISTIILTLGYLIFCCFVDFSHKLLIYFYFLLQMIQYFYLYTARGFSANQVYAISGIISAFAVAASSIICIYCFDMTIQALYISQIVSLLIQIIYIELKIHLIKDICHKKVDKLTLLSLYKFCFPESIGTIFNWLLSSVNRIIIVAALGFASNGIYAISNKFLAILNVFMTAFVLSFQEVIYAADREHLEEVGNDVLHKFAKFAGVAVAIILLGTSIVFPWFISGEYIEGYALIPLFYLYFLFSGITWILSSIVSATKLTQIVLYEKVIIGTVNLIIMICLVKPIGLFSSPIALLIAEFIGMYAFKILLKQIAKFNVILPMKMIIMDVVIIMIATVFFFINNTLLNMLMIALICIMIVIKYKCYLISLIGKIVGR